MAGSSYGSGESFVESIRNFVISQFRNRLEMTRDVGALQNQVIDMGKESAPTRPKDCESSKMKSTSGELMFVRIISRKCARLLIHPQFADRQEQQ